MMKRTIATVLVLAALGGGGTYGWLQLSGDVQKDLQKASFALIYAVLAVGLVLAFRGAREAEAKPS
ncbi:MAG: hypothetical protein EXR71_03145 [Myxococcales bacterium]|nr:hypothetical protein [Myxococcales bacterium]